MNFKIFWIVFCCFCCYFIISGSSTQLSIIGLFPTENEQTSNKENSDSSMYWTTQSYYMFLSAIELAQRYGLTVNGKTIQEVAHRIEITPNGFPVLDHLCRMITEEQNLTFVGLIGPGCSNCAQLVGMLAGQINLPIFSYAATDYTLGNIHVYPTLYRIIPSDRYLSDAIGKLFENFLWNKSIVIFEQSDFGYGGLRVLLENQQNNIDIEKRILYNPQSDQFNVDFNKTIERCFSSIIIVWANRKSSTSIIKHALHANFLNGDFTWILVDEIDLSVFTESDQIKLQGLISLLPTVLNEKNLGVNLSLRGDAFNVFKEKTSNLTVKPRELNEISPYAMYTFDATWTLILALNKLQGNDSLPFSDHSCRCFDTILRNKHALIENLNKSNFSGITGLINFDKTQHNDRLQGFQYGLFNVQLEQQQYTNSKLTATFVQVMCWRQESGRWQNATNSEQRQIIWPGGIKDKIPSDTKKLKDVTVRVIVLEAPPFVIVNNSTKTDCDDRIGKVDDPTFEEKIFLPTECPGLTVSGFWIDILEELKKTLKFQVKITLSNSTMNNRQLVDLISDSNSYFDLAISDLRITSNQSQWIDFTVAVHEDYLKIIVRKESKSRITNLFSCFNPFTWQVWLTIFGLLMYSSILIFAFEYERIEHDLKHSLARRILVGIFRTASSVVIMSGDVPLRSTASRLIAMGLYGLGIILAAIYTANLTSFLTLSRTGSNEITIEDIKNGLIPFERIGIVYGSPSWDYYRNSISDVYYRLETNRDIFPRLRDETIDAAIWGGSNLDYAVFEYYCGILETSTEGFLPSAYGIALQKGWPYKEELNAEILKIRESDQIDAFVDFWFKKRSCSEREKTDKNESATIETLDLDVMAGVFILFLIFSTLSIFISLFRCQKCVSSKNLTNSNEPSK